MKNEDVRFASGLIIALALWQICSPLILGYADNAVALWDALNVGVAVLALAAYRMFRPPESAVASWINLLLGAWLAASPFALGLTNVRTAMWNDITVGISIVVFALSGLALTAHSAKS